MLNPEEEEALDIPIEKEQETPLKRIEKVTVTPSDFIDDPTHQAAAKAVEKGQSEELVVFQRSKKKRQQQVLRDEAAVADALQRETVMGQQTTEHYALRSSPIITTTTSETGNSL